VDFRDQTSPNPASPVAALIGTYILIGAASGFRSAVFQGSAHKPKTIFNLGQLTWNRRKLKFSDNSRTFPQIRARGLPLWRHDPTIAALRGRRVTFSFL